MSPIANWRNLPEGSNVILSRDPKRKGPARIGCDKCGVVLEGQFDSVRDAETAAIDAGWTVREIYGLHYAACKECECLQ